MTCKECLHCGCCHNEIAYGMGSDDITGKYFTDIETRCKHFKNKADFAEVKRGKWVFFARDIAGKAFFCSLCGNVETTEVFEVSPLENDCNYCSKCGAKMEG